jgi:hypothetical protein
MESDAGRVGKADQFRTFQSGKRNWSGCAILSSPFPAKRAMLTSVRRRGVRIHEHAGRVVNQMESHRCKMVAIEMDDPRGANLLGAVAIEVEDTRCRSLAEGYLIQVEDARYRHVAIKMEDPRCQNLRDKW